MRAAQIVYNSKNGPPCSVVGLDPLAFLVLLKILVMEKEFSALIRRISSSDMIIG